MKSESGFSFVMASQPFVHHVLRMFSWYLKDTLEDLVGIVEILSLMIQTNLMIHKSMLV